MLPQSVRLVVGTAPQSAAVASLTSSVPRAAAAFGIAYKPSGHQRRYSSSKPSSPDDGSSSRDFTSRPAVPASGSSKTGEKRKRKAKEATPAAPRLPSVPSTRHIKDEALALSTFFALHRPISVTQLLPKTVTEDAFAEIFNQKRGHRVQDVLSTLSQTVHDLDKLSLGDKQQQEAEDGTAKVNIQNPDGSEATIHFQLNTMSGHFLPFTPPPAPQPVSETQAEMDAAAAAEEMAEQQEPQTRVYKALVTIEETVDANGKYNVVAHSPQLVEDDAQPRSFLERMAQRQMRFEDAQTRQDRTMHAMSVRRLRKLRMKRRKYKKLSRRTRNLRRKQDRL